MKRNRNDTDDNDSNDSFLDREYKETTNKLESIKQHKRKRSDSIDKKDEKILDNIDKEMFDREITINKILKLNLSIEDNIWFLERINILNNMEFDTIERLELKSMIYEKYKNVMNPEFGKLKKLQDESGDMNEITTRILNSNHSDYVKTILYRKYMHATDSGSTDEYFKVIEWIDCVLQVPTEIKTNFNEMKVDERLEKFWHSINNHVYGLKHVKEKLLETMCAMLLNRKNFGKIITLCGPPGVGKSSIGIAIAEAFDMPFDQISLSDINDASVLVGHSPTYVGARSGVFIDILKRNRQLDSVILLDEIDKISVSEEGATISSKLLKILDKVQNKRFNDAYMPEIDIDMSNIIFIVTANDQSKIPEPLRDRLNIINIDGYDIEDKVAIAKTHMIDRITSNLGFPKNAIVMSDDIIKYIITNKIEQTPGVRGLERALEQLFERLAVITHLKNDKIELSYKMSKLKFPIVINKQHIDMLIKI
jgi:ATP-dependent Lon protease